MRTKRIFNLRRFLQLMACFLVIVPTYSWVKEKESVPTVSNINDSLSIDFNKMRTAVTAKYVLVPWSDLSRMKSVTSWDEKTFNEIGCTYFTQDKADIGSLVEIIFRANIHKNPSLQTESNTSKNLKFLPSAREGVYLSFSDGTEAKFLISQEMGLSDVHGQFTHEPKFKDMPFKADHSLPWYLTFWASQVIKTNQLDNPLNKKDAKNNSETLSLKKSYSSAEECESYIRVYIYHQRPY